MRSQHISPEYAKHSHFGPFRSRNSKNWIYSGNLSPRLRKLYNRQAYRHTYTHPGVYSDWLCVGLYASRCMSNNDVLAGMRVSCNGSLLFLEVHIFLVWESRTVVRCINNPLRRIFLTPANYGGQAGSSAFHLGLRFLYTSP